MPPLPDVSAWIDSQSDRMCGLVTQWANVNSYSHNLAGLAELSDLLKSQWSALGEVEELPIGPDESIDSSGQVVQRPLGKALRIIKRPHAPLRVFLCIHMDTVYPPDSPFQTVKRLDANHICGPGVCDAKGGLAVMLVAVEAIEQSPWADRIGWEVLINPDEEIGSPGSSPLFDQAAKRNHVGLLFEPALPDGSLVAERGGSGNYTLVVHGRSAHAGREPHLGRNAIALMAECAVKLSALTDLGITVNVGHVEGGGPVNVVPALAICRFNVRAKTPADQQRLQSAIQQIVIEANHREGFHVSLHGGFHRPPKPATKESQHLQQLVEQCATELNIPVSWRSSGGVSDGNQLSAAGLPNLDSLGPRGDKIHSHDEYLLVDSLTERAKLAWKVVGQLAVDGKIFNRDAF